MQLDLARGLWFASPSSRDRSAEGVHLRTQKAARGQDQGQLSLALSTELVAVCFGWGNLSACKHWSQDGFEGPPFSKVSHVSAVHTDFLRFLDHPCTRVKLEE